MKVSVIAVGRLKKGPEAELYKRYADRISGAGKGVGLGPFSLTEFNEAQGSSADLRSISEAEKLIHSARDCDHIIALDERGKSMTSRAFASHLSRVRDDGCSSLAFLIGGPDGHGEAVKSAAQMRLSLGPLTLPHGLARIVLVEQIYRAITIMSGHPYHRD